MGNLLAPAKMFSHGNLDLGTNQPPLGLGYHAELIEQDFIEFYAFGCHLYRP